MKLYDLDLIFIALPTAINEMESPNMWVFCLGATLFLLGIDSSTSYLESVSAGIQETKFGTRLNKQFIAACLCGISLLVSLLFCANNGQIAVNMFSHYINTYCVFLISLFQVIGAAWVNGYPESIAAVIRAKKALPKSERSLNDQEDEDSDIDTIPCTMRDCKFGCTMEKVQGVRGASLALIIVYWPVLIGFGLVNFAFIQNRTFYTWLGFQIYVLVVVPFISYYVFAYRKYKMDFWTWLDQIFLYGIRPILYTVVRTVHKGFDRKKYQKYREKPLSKGESCFIYLVGYALKYIAPHGIVWFFLMNVSNSITVSRDISICDAESEVSFKKN